MAKKVKKAKGKPSFGRQVFMIFLAIAGIIFLSTSIVLLIGMMPSFAAFLTDHTRRKSRAVSVAAMNLAGCSTFLFELWIGGGSFEKAFDIIMSPTAIIVMYTAALIGYMIDWSMSGIVANIMYQKGIARQSSIEKRQEELIERWGKEVTNEMPLDEFGFAIAPNQPPRE